MPALQNRNSPAEAGAQSTTGILYHNGTADQGCTRKEGKIKTRSLKTEGCGTLRSVKRKTQNVSSDNTIASISSAQFAPL